MRSVGTARSEQDAGVDARGPVFVGRCGPDADDGSGVHVRLIGGRIGYCYCYRGTYTSSCSGVHVRVEGHQRVDIESCTNASSGPSVHVWLICGGACGSCIGHSIGSFYHCTCICADVYVRGEASQRVYIESGAGRW